jgi:hypothetical protein
MLSCAFSFLRCIRKIPGTAWPYVATWSRLVALYVSMGIFLGVRCTKENEKGVIKAKGFHHQTGKGQSMAGPSLPVHTASSRVMARLLLIFLGAHGRFVKPIYTYTCTERTNHFEPRSASCARHARSHRSYAHDRWHDRHAAPLNRPPIWRGPRPMHVCRN